MSAFIHLFPIWAALGASLGFYFAGSLSNYASLIVPLLMLVIFCMGLTLRVKDFVEVGHYKKALFAGLILQFSVMPFSALMLSKAFHLDHALTIGMLLVGSVAGGTASNVMTYLARGHVALSVSMTAFSTLLSVVLTPLILTLLLGTRVSLPAIDMLFSLLQIILIPIALGLLLNSVIPHHIVKLQALLPSLSITIIALIIAIVVALNADRLATVNPVIILTTLLHNLIGLVLGYLAASLLHFNSPVRRTIALEVGMQNSGLATALALKYFSPVSALPGAIFSVWLNITGSIFAAFSRHKKN